MKSEIEFRAETFRIVGIAFCSPLGKLLLNPLDILEKSNWIVFILYLTFSLVGLYCGINVILRAHELLSNHRRKNDLK